MFRYPILHLFTQDDTVVEFGVAAMKYFCPFYFLLAILHSLAGAVRGTGQQRALHRGRAGEIHIRHPQGHNVVLSAVLANAVPFGALRSHTINARVEKLPIELHVYPSFFSGSLAHSTQKPPDFFSVST